MLKTFFALIFIFLFISYSIHLVTKIGRIVELLFRSPPAFYAFVLGIFLSFLLIKFGWDGKFIHSFQHELTHAAAGLPFGAKVLHFEAGNSGGKVVLSKSNPIILIAPYIVPPISMFILVVTFFLKPGVLRLVLTTASGFHYGHYVVVTMKSLGKQEELKEVGRFFAYSAIILGNLLVLSLIVSILVPEISWLGSLRSSVAETVSRLLSLCLRK